MNFNEICAIYKSILLQSTLSPRARIIQIKSKESLHNFLRTYTYCDDIFRDWRINAEFLEYLFMNGLVR